MSVWLVTKQDIDAMVNWLVRYGIVPEGEADSAGHTLWSENYRSWNDKYNEADEVPEYRYVEPVATINGRGTFDPENPVHALRIAAYYDYQACEAPQYEKGEALRLVIALRDRVAQELGVDPSITHPMQIKPWGLPAEAEEAWEQCMRGIW